MALLRNLLVVMTPVPLPSAHFYYSTLGTGLVEERLQRAEGGMFSEHGKLRKRNSV
jgi:hypothetical protein